jgi:hypothetical protein
MILVPFCLVSFSNVKQKQTEIKERIRHLKREINQVNESWRCLKEKGLNRLTIEKT